MLDDGIFLVLFAFMVILLAQIMNGSHQKRINKIREQEEQDRRRRVDSLYGRNKR